MIGILTAAALTAAHADCLVVTGARVELPEGPRTGPAVVASGEQIAGVGEQVAGLTTSGSKATYRGEDCTVVDGTGRSLTAGLVAAPTQLGLVEVGLERSSRDDDPLDDDPIHASLVAADAYDPLSVLIRVQRIEGITAALTVPGGGFVGGMGAMVRLRGATQAQAVLDPRAVMAVRIPSASFADGLRQIRELLADATTHARNPRLYDQGRPYPEGASRADLEALAPVARGAMPVLLTANGASHLEALARLKEETGLDLVVAGAAEGWRVAEILARAQIPVVVDPFVFGPGGFDQVHARPDNAARLAEAGVPLILSAGGFGTHNVRTLRQAAGNAVREGLPHDEAVRAITATPAATFGQPDRGRIAVGAKADLVLWSGDPLELSTVAERVFIDGVEVELTSRQTELRDRYRTLPGHPIPLDPSAAGG